MTDSEGDPRNRILSLLQGIGGVLGSGSISFVLDLTRSEAEEQLEALRSDGLVKQVQSCGARGWLVASDGRQEDAAELPDEMMEKLAEFVLVSPGAILSEIIAVLRWKRLPARERSKLLLTALRESWEHGEFSLFSRLFMQFVELDIIEDREISEVLRMFQPRRLRGYSIEKAEDFVQDAMQVLRAPSDRILALTRLGELEFIQNRSSAAEELLMEALELSMEKGSPQFLPSILESLAELPRDHQGISEMAFTIEKVLDWSDSLDDTEMRTLIRASAALAQSGLRMDSLAERTILSAMAGISTLPLPAQLMVEWCRARIYMASGRRKTAISMLQRSLMLAEGAGDQLTVMEILTTLIAQMKERPGYTIRNLITIMRNISRKSASTGNLSIRIYALDNLADMYMRTLQFADSMQACEKCEELLESSEILRDLSLSDWCAAYTGFLLGRDADHRRGEGMLPGTSGFLQALLEDRDPVEQASMIAQQMMAAPREDRQVYVLVLAMEAFIRGAVKASSMLAAALDSTYGGSTRDPYISWKLCVSGMLSSREIYSDDFFHSAQVLARQLDRILVVWLILRCRLSLDMERDPFGRTALLMLAAELDGYIMEQLREEEASVFLKRSGAAGRLDAIRSITGTGTGTPPAEMREILAGMAGGTVTDRIMEIGSISSRISGRSEISASLEILGRLLDADRVMALRVGSGEIEIIEGYGTGKWRMPGIEVQDLLLERPSEELTVESYGVTPFGSRRCIVMPVGGVPGTTQKRTMIPEHSESESYLLAEMESPAPEYGPVPDFLTDIIRGQVTAALRLRTRESMAYMDRLTGAVIGYSWTSRLEELAADQLPDGRLSILIVGVDGMDDVNRLFGFRVGDSVLKAIVATIRGILRPNDLLGRIRGSVFGIVLPDTGEDDARQVAERICGTVAGVDIRPDRVPVTVSIGLTSAGSGEKGHDLLLSRGSDAMRVARSRGGNRSLQWSGDLELQDGPAMRLFNTGDPGWDHSVFGALMDMLSAEQPDMEFICSKLRDALRSIMVYIENGRGGRAFVGSRFLRGIADETGTARTGTVTFHPSLLGKYDALSVGLAGGGRLIAAWESSGGISLSVRNVFSALAGLSGLLLRRMD